MSNDPSCPSPGTSVVGADAPAAPSQGDLFVVSAPSGAGKTTLVRALFASGKAAGLAYSVSHTTRPIRVGEVDGSDYHFVDVPTFREMIARNAFFEWADVHGQLKGTSAEWIIGQTAAGTDVLLDIDVQGAFQVRARVPEAQLIFILPPSAEELERRLRHRGADDKEQIARRIVDSAREVGKCLDYDYVIVNEEVDVATNALVSIVCARRHRRQHQQRTIEQIMAGFEKH